MHKFNKLSRAEMKNFTGGQVQGQAYCTFSGTCSTWGNAGPYDQEGDGSWIIASLYQQDADDWCAVHNCCTNVDCPGAV